MDKLGIYGYFTFYYSSIKGLDNDNLSSIIVNFTFYYSSIKGDEKLYMRI